MHLILTFVYFKLKNLFQDEWRATYWTITDGGHQHYMLIFIKEKQVAAKTVEQRF